MIAVTANDGERGWLLRGRSSRPLVTVTSIVAVLLLGLSVAVTLIIVSERKQEIATGERELSQLSLALAEYSARTLQSVDLMLAGVAEHIRLEPIASPADAHAVLGTEAFHSYLVGRVRDAPQMDGMGFVAADGRPVNTSRGWPPSGSDLTDRDFFAPHRDQAGLGSVVGGPAISSSTGQRMLYLSRRVDGPSGEFLGVLVSAIKANYFEDFFRAVLPDPDAVISLRRDTGVSLARVVGSEGEEDDSPSSSSTTLTVTAARNGDVRTAPSVDGNAQRWMAAHTVPGYPLIVSVSNGENAMLADWRRNRNVILLASSAVVLMILLSGLLLGRQFALIVQVARSEAKQDEHQRAEAHIRELNENLTASLARLQTISDNIPAMIIYSDANRVIRFINRTGATWLARPEREIIGKTFSEILGRPPRVETDTLIERLAHGPYFSERVQQHPDGRVRVLDAVDVADRGPDGEFLGYYSLRVDITERRESEKQVKELHDTLRANIRQLRSITDNIPVLIAYIDHERRIRFINKTGEQWYARPASEILGRKASEIVGRGPTLNDDTMFRRLTDGPVTYETVSPMPDGVTRTLSMLRVPDVETDGSLRGYYVLLTDITQQRLIEEQLRQSQKLEAIGKLTGGVAHDFNNLLAVIVGNLDLVIEDTPDADRRTKLQAAIRACKRAASLTQSLLAFSRQQALNPTILDLAALVSETAELIRRTAPANISMQMQSEVGLWHCEADAAQLENAILNLVVNACDAMPNGGRLTIETKNARLGRDYAAANPEVVAGDYVMLAVSDTGTGMPPEVIARAFEPFFTTKSVGKGTGLGLSMVYGFARQSGGHAKIYSEMGNGTVVKLYLPRRDAEGQPQNGRASSDPTRLPTGFGEAVLVVEDNSDVRELVCNQLRALGYDVIEAGDGAAALALLRAHSEIDLLLADVVLPGDLSGLETAVKARALRPGLAVLHMSGYTANAMINNGRLPPGTQLLQKPFSRRELATKVRDALDADLD